MNTRIQVPLEIKSTNPALFSFRIKALFVTLLILFTQVLSYAEGTKQIMPNAGNPAYFVLDNGWSPFALYNCPATSRLYISICNPGEKIYFGFRQPNNDVRFRIMDPFGGQVYPALPAVDAPVPTAGAGFISTYAQAIAGPSQAGGGVTGYNALSFTPASGPGDYYIEFLNRGSRRDFTYFDITVATSANAAIPGRLWSQAWMVNSTNYTNPFKGKFYIYADDGIVTSVEFNDIKPYVFVISANPSGTQSTAVPNIDRRSRAGNVTYPQYKIFLNDPDHDCFPTGAFGSLTAPSTIAGCGLDRCINISVDQPGNILVLLDLNGTSGYQPGTTDRQLSATVVPG